MSFGDYHAGVDPVVIGRATKTEYTANGGVLCPNVTLGSARTGDKAKSASGLTSASESAYGTAAAGWTPTKRTVPAVAKVMANAGQFGDGGTELTPTLPLNKVHQDNGGTLDLPAITKVAPSDTLEGVTGTMDIPALSSVVPPDTLEGVTGTSDKLYSVTDEAVRNTVPTLSSIPTPATGGPAAWLQLNVSRVGTQDMDAVKSAYEAGRNNDNGTVASQITVPASVKIRNVTITGTNAGGTPPTTSEVEVDIVEAVAGD